METGLQDKAWACLSKEVRDNIRISYKNICENNESDLESFLEEIYGEHNLASDTEPAEILIVERGDIINRYNGILAQQDPKNFGYSAYNQGQKDLLHKLFGDKCLPEQILEQILEHTSVQAENKPKFKIGDKVRKKNWDKDTTISKIEWHGTWDTFVYRFKEQEYGFNCHKEKDLTLVSKRSKDPEFQIGDKVQLQFDWCRISKETLLTIKDIPTIDRDNTFMYSFEEIEEYIRETMLKPYTEENEKNCKEIQNLSLSDEQTTENKENMEEKEFGKEDNFPTKELNLCELLKGYEGEGDVFYSPICGECEYKESIDGLELMRFEANRENVDGGYQSLAFDFEGKHGEHGTCMLYPSRDLYLKYPLDAYKAWQEWAEARKPKRWYPQHGEEVWYLDLSMKPKKTYSRIPYSQWEGELNCFQTEELCRQAAEAVRECLEKFYEKGGGE